MAYNVVYFSTPDIPHTRRIFHEHAKKKCVFCCYWMHCFINIIEVLDELAFYYIKAFSLCLVVLILKFILTCSNKAIPAYFVVSTWYIYSILLTDVFILKVGSLQYKLTLEWCWGQGRVENPHMTCQPSAYTDSQLPGDS